LVLLIVQAQAQKNDTVYLYNGDRITGELKKFEYGLLFLKADVMQTVNIEFDRIRTQQNSELDLDYRISAGSGSNMT
jgi:hypothetical protein